MIRPLGEDAEDAVRWWQAYVLAENDQLDELRERATAGDEHAKRQLASWLSDRARTEEAIAVIRPLADAGDDMAELWLARWLAECGQIGELRQRADAGNDHALDELAAWLATHHRFDELRELISAGRGRAAQLPCMRPDNPHRTKPAGLLHCLAPVGRLAHHGDSAGRAAGQAVGRDVVPGG